MKSERPLFPSEKTLKTLGTISALVLVVSMIYLYPLGGLFSWKQVAAPRGDTVSIFENNKNGLRVSIAGMITPTETFAQYLGILKYLSEKTGRPVSLIQRKTYQEVNNLLKQGKVDLAFICTGSYLELVKEGSAELLVVPLMKGKPEYYSYIIVRRDSSISNFEDLQGMSFAFTDPLSLTGKRYPTYLIKKMGLTPETYFSRSLYLRNHDNSIQAVQRGIVSAAAVDSLVFDYLATKKPYRVKDLKIILKSPPFGIPPVVVRKGLSRQLKNQLKEALLVMHQNKEGRKILSKMLIDRFVTGNDKMYDSVREME